MNPITKLQRLAAEWAAYCRLAARYTTRRARLDHAACREIIDLGPAAVPDIMDRLADDEVVPWELVLQEITGVRAVDDPEDFDPGVARRHIHVTR